MPGPCPGRRGPMGRARHLPCPARTRRVLEHHRRATCGGARSGLQGLVIVGVTAVLGLPALAHADTGVNAAWPWAFAALAVAAMVIVGWLAWCLGRARAVPRVPGDIGPQAAAVGAITAFTTGSGPDRVRPAAADAAAQQHGARPAAQAAPGAPLAAGALLARLLDLQTQAALLLARPDDAHDALAAPPATVLRHLNAAARQLLPGASAGQPADPWLTQLSQAVQTSQTSQTSEPTQPSGFTQADGQAGSGPGALAAAVAQLPPGGRTQVGPWQLARIGALDGGGDAIVLLHQPTAPVQAEADASAQVETEQFSFTLSHDLRAPIRVVEGFTRIVKEDYGALLDRVGNDHLDRVLGAAARMNLMIDALLTLARLSRQPVSRQAVNLSQLAQWVSEELRRTAPEREVQFEIEPGLQATGDPTLLRLVLENLLGNAWKYTSRNERSLIRFACVTHAHAPAYLVQDNGAGFDMRGADRLFGLFQRLHSASEFPGTGVGLASVRRIVQRHGGRIWAEAEPGRGASFYFTLPT